MKMMRFIALSILNHPHLASSQVQIPKLKQKQKKKDVKIGYI